ncbi:hypothetical protein B0H11DRAFT_2092942 [Mycena galericulata]|nr:hypothetical protein B0H11DRAFT_2092942 [Mycena galericulata]
MYSKNGGKAGAHSWVPTCDTIGSLSYLVHSYRRQFKFIDRNYAVLRTLRFAHLPPNSFPRTFSRAGSVGQGSCKP